MNDHQLTHLARRIDGLHQRLDAITARLERIDRLEATTNRIEAQLTRTNPNPTGPIARNGHHFYPGTGWLPDPPHQETE